MTRALALRDAAVAALVAASPGGVSGNAIFTDLRRAIARTARPAIVIDMGDEDAPERQYGIRRRTLALTVRILADGPDPFAVIDPIRAAAHAALMADVTFGGLADSLEEGGSSRDRVDLEVQIGSLVTVYQARYTTTGESL